MEETNENAEELSDDLGSISSESTDVLKDVSKSVSHHRRQEQAEREQAEREQAEKEKAEKEQAEKEQAENDKTDSDKPEQGEKGQDKNRQKNNRQDNSPNNKKKQELNASKNNNANNTNSTKPSDKENESHLSNENKKTTSHNGKVDISSKAQSKGVSIGKEEAKKSAAKAGSSEFVKALASIFGGTAFIVGIVIFFVFIVVIAFVCYMSSQNSNEYSGLDGLPPFITSEMLVASLEVQETNHYPASTCVAQIIAESGFGKYGPGGESGQGLSKLAFDHKNLFGIKGTGTAGYVEYPTGEQTTSGGSYTIVAKFRAYYTYTECIKDRAKILGEVYSDLINGVTDGKLFARQIGKRWATSVSYSDRLVQLIDEYDLTRLDSMTVDDLKKLSGGNVPRYYQSDYANVPYGSSSLAACGCGPTCFAMVASAISGKKITPPDAVAWCGNSYYVAGSGTSWGYFQAASNHFNLNTTIQVVSPSSGNEVINALKCGKIVISSQRAGVFTSGGHFIVLAAITNDNRIVVNDPNKNNAVNKGYNDKTFDFNSDINSTALQYWIFG